MIFTAMRKTKNLFILSSLLVLVLGISSCSDFDNGYTSKDIAYKEQFYNMFGNADPNHTWNMAEVCSLDVTIHMEGTYTVKVWTANPRSSENNAYLLGQYDHVAGGTSNIFGCDIPATVETAYVGIISENGDRIIESAKVKDGKASVTFGTQGTRTAYSGSGTFTYTAINKSNGKEFQRGDMDVILGTLPEYQPNIGKVSQDFEYESTGDFTIYPIYSITGNAGSTGFGERLGIYLYDSNGAKTEPVWIWQSTRGGDVIDGVTQSCWFDGYNSNSSGWETDFVSFVADRAAATEAEAQGKKVVWKGDNFVSPYTAIRAEGITVSIPVGTRFGMVLDASGGDPYCSNSAYNQDQGWPFPGTQTGTDGVKDVYAATFEDKQGRLYLAFEDWNYGSEWHDCDFNDVVFVMPDVEKNPVIIDKDMQDVSMSYIVACEDLGGTFDWDFNDVVYAIEHVSGQETARLKLLAAGGTLPVKISYTHNGNEQILKFNGKEDLHDAFGVDLNTPVNVGGYQHTPIYSETFTVEANAFSMSTHASDFKIHVEYADGSQGAQIGVPDRDGAIKEPQAFLVADPNWKWPNEKVCITNLYPDFASWIADQNLTSWCGSVWGMNTNLTGSSIFQTGDSQDVLQYVEYSESELNVATFPLKQEQMIEFTAYQIVMTASADATVKFYRADGSEMPLDNGYVPANNQAVFTLSGEALKQLRGGRMTITFAEGQNANGLLTEFLWVNNGEEATELEEIVPELIVTPTSLTFEIGGNDQRISATSNSTGTITYTSSNKNVATVDDHGNVTPVGAGTAYIAVKQAAAGGYSSTVKYVAVEVLAAPAQEPTEDAWFTGGNFKVNDYVNGEKMAIADPRWVTDPTDSGNGCIEVTTNASPSASWDAQFFVSIPESESPLKEGDKYRLTMKVRADVAQTQPVGSQSHSSPGNYIHYDAGVGNINVTTDWVTITTEEITVTHDMSPEEDNKFMKTIAFNLANSTQATNYYFDDVTIEIISRANLQDPNLNLNNSTLSMYVNDTQSVGFSKNGNGAISFAYSDNTVASAALDGNNIKITGLKAGTTTITVRLDAEGNYKTVKKTIEVTVSERPAGTPTPVSATIATDTPQHDGQSITGNWYKLPGSELQKVNPGANGVMLEFVLPKSGVSSFYMGGPWSCHMFELKKGDNEDFITPSISVTSNNNTYTVGVVWNGGWSENADGIPARTLRLTISSDVWYSINGNGLYFGGGLGNEYVDGTVSVTVTPVN